jgi:hypothetical protein
MDIIKNETLEFINLLKRYIFLLILTTFLFFIYGWYYSNSKETVFETYYEITTPSYEVIVKILKKLGIKENISSEGIFETLIRESFKLENKKNIIKKHLTSNDFLELSQAGKTILTELFVQESILKVSHFSSDYNKSKEIIFDFLNLLNKKTLRELAFFNILKNEINSKQRDEERLSLILSLIELRSNIIARDQIDQLDLLNTLIKKNKINMDKMNDSNLDFNDSNLDFDEFNNFNFLRLKDEGFIVQAHSTNKNLIVILFTLFGLFFSVLMIILLNYLRKR